MSDSEIVEFLRRELGGDFHLPLSSFGLYHFNSWDEAVKVMEHLTSAPSVKAAVRNAK